MKKRVLLLSLLLLAACSSKTPSSSLVNTSSTDNEPLTSETSSPNEDHSPLTGPAYAKVLSINYSLSSKENDLDFHSEDIISLNDNNAYDLSINASYTICLAFNIGGGSIPPAIEASSLNIEFDNNYVLIDRLTSIDSTYLNYVEYFNLATLQSPCETEIIFSLDKITTTMSISIK